VGDEHGFALFAYQQDADDLAVTFGGLYVNDALAAASGETVFVDRSAFAEAILGDGENEVR
jgi:hypothetical protein